MIMTIRQIINGCVRLFKVLCADYFLRINAITIKTGIGTTITLYNPIIDILIQFMGKPINISINTDHFMSFTFRIAFRTNVIVHLFNQMNNAESEAYYANLRAYKATAWNYNRPVAFGWYSNWAPAGAYRRGYLSAMPDSMDFVSMWSGAPGRYEITPEQKADKEFVQKVKGTKLLQVSLLSYLGKGATPN